jgi:hypothetical protein
VHWRERLPTAGADGDAAPVPCRNTTSRCVAGPSAGTVHEGLPQHDDGVLPDCWLLVQWPPGQNEPTVYWLPDLPPDTSLSDLVRLA